MKIKRCVNCVNDNTVKHISFDENGVCNFCNTYQKMKSQLTNFDELEKLFLDKINKNKGKHKYDVALGLSGGKDSSYVLYKLIHDYKLKVYTYTLDNGFMSDEAKEKINNLVKMFNVEHEYIKTDETLLKKMYKLTLQKFLSPCIACSYLGYASMINITTKVDASVGMHGRSRPQMFRMLDEKYDDIFKDFIMMGLDKNDKIDYRMTYKNALSKIEKYIDINLSNEINSTILKDANEKGYRDFIAYFLYHPYEKGEIIRFLEEKTDWKVIDEEEHFDCLIHNAATYIKNLTSRRLHILPEISVMIRENTITKEEALKLINEKNIKFPKNEFNKMCKYANVNKTFLILKAKIYAKRWW